MIKTIAAANKEALYDLQAKKLLGNKKILAFIIVCVIDEFKGIGYERIVPLIDSVYVGEVPVEPGMTNVKTGNDLVGMNTEESEINGDKHSFDVVEGPMADDAIYNYVEDYLDGELTREEFWALARFKYPTHQICFCTEKALSYLNFRC